MIATELYSSSLGYFSVPPDSMQPLRGRGTQEEHVLVKVGQAQPVFWILAPQRLTRPLRTVLEGPALHRQRGRRGVGSGVGCQKHLQGRSDA